MKILLKMMLVVSGLVLVGCGGGGGEIPSTGTQVNEQETIGDKLIYTGKNTPAKLDKETAQDFIETLNVSYADMIDIPDGSQGKVAKKTSSLIQRYDKKTNGSKSGTVEVTEKEIDNVTKETIAIFKNFNDGDGETIDGRVTYLVTVDEQESFFIKKMDIKLELLNIKDSEIDIVMDGSLTMLASDDGKRKTFTQNIIIKNNTDNMMVKLEDLKIVLNEYDQELSYNGKIYHSEKGYIEVSTPVELRYDETGSPMVGGEILYESENATIKERIAYDNRIRVELDEGKDGSIDDVEVYDADTLEVVPNTAPIINISFPQSIYTDTDMSKVNVNIYDPDLDGFTTSYEWQINGEVKGSDIVFDNTLFKKHDMLKLTVEVTDDRAGDAKTNTQSKAQEVLNSRPIITESFEKLTLELGETANLIYSISDADNDEIIISWKHYHIHAFYGKETINEYYNPSFTQECELAIQDFDMNHPKEGYATLSRDEQEDFNRTYCLEDIPGQIVQYDFIQEKVFDAVAPGLYLHEMVVSDGDYNRTRVFDSNIPQTEIVESQVNNHDQYTYNTAYSIYMKDFDNDGHKDLIYILNHRTLVIEYRNGEAILNKVTYDIETMKNYYVNDINGDGKMDIVFVYSNYNNTSDNTGYGKMTQLFDGSLGDLVKFSLDNRIRGSLLIDDINNDSKEDMIILGANAYGNNGKVIIYPNDMNYSQNIIANTTIPDTLSHYGLETKILLHDLDKNGKKDIILVNKNFTDENNKLTFVASILSQESNGTFGEVIYEEILEENLANHEQITDIIISDLGDMQDVFIVVTTQHIYLMKLEDNSFTIVNKIDYLNSKNKLSTRILSPADISGDGKKDLIVVEPNSINLLSVFIQKEDNNFFGEQNYFFSDDYGYATDLFNPKYTFGDINKDGKYEIFFSTGEDKLSTIYFK